MSKARTFTRQRIRQWKPARIAIDFGLHPVWQHKERIGMAEFHGGDDRCGEAEFVSNHSKNDIVVLLVGVGSVQFEVN